MRIRKLILSIFWLSLFCAFGAGFLYAWKAFPIISGYGAKNLCSGVFLQHRKPVDIIREDLGDFPLSLGRFTVNEQDSSVTGSVFGLAQKKAIYRKGIGCTLVNDFTETQIRSQHFNAISKPLVASDNIAWPLGDLLPAIQPSGIDQQKLDQAIDNVFHETNKGRPANTRAVLVLYDGQLLAERYATGFDRNTVMLGWSVSKSLTSALIGILVKEGKLKLDEPAPVPEWKGNEKEKITLKDLLQQSSGLEFREVYTGPSDVTNMLFKRGDMAAFTAMHPLKDKPGTVFNYSSGNSNILSRIIRQTVGERDYTSFPYEALFHKIGMYSMLLEPDASGTYIGSSYSYGTARDFARFGLLYYNNGKWNGEQILPEYWVRETVQPAPADPLMRYGYQFWLNGLDEKDRSKRQFPDVPADMFYADGYGGQDIYIIPSRKLVVLRLGLHVINENQFLKEVLDAFKP